MRRLTWLPLLFFSVSLLLGCEARRISDDPVDKGIELIDKGDYNGAIVYLQDLLNRDSRDDVRIALATAYVGRSGVILADYWKIIKAMQTQPIDDQLVMSHPIYSKNKENIESIDSVISNSVEKSLDQLLKGVAAFEIYRTRINFLPYVKKDNRADIQTGIDTLEGIASPGGRVYRAVLVTTLLRSDLADGYDVWSDIEERLRHAFDNSGEAVELFCNPVTGDFVQWLLQHFNNTATATEDLQVAFPSDKESFQPFTESIQSLQDQIPVMQDSLVPVGCP